MLLGALPSTTGSSLACLHMRRGDTQSQVPWPDMVAHPFSPSPRTGEAESADLCEFRLAWAI